MLKDPVGAIVNTWELYKPVLFIFSNVSGNTCALRYSDFNTASKLNLGYAPSNEFAISADSSIAWLANKLAIALHTVMPFSESYLMPILIRASEIPITPKPICLQLRTDSCWILRGCKGRPSISTLLRARTAI